MGHYGWTKFRGVHPGKHLSLPRNSRHLSVCGVLISAIARADLPETGHLHGSHARDIANVHKVRRGPSLWQSHHDGDVIHHHRCACTRFIVVGVYNDTGAGIFVVFANAIIFGPCSQFHMIPCTSVFSSRLSPLHLPHNDNRSAHIQPKFMMVFSLRSRFALLLHTYVARPFPPVFTLSSCLVPIYRCSPDFDLPFFSHRLPMDGVV